MLIYKVFVVLFFFILFVCQLDDRSLYYSIFSGSWEMGRRKIQIIIVGWRQKIGFYILIYLAEGYFVFVEEMVLKFCLQVLQGRGFFLLLLWWGGGRIQSFVYRGGVLFYYFGWEIWNLEFCLQVLRKGCCFIIVGDMDDRFLFISYIGEEYIFLLL